DVLTRCPQTPCARSVAPAWRGPHSGRQSSAPFSYPAPRPGRPAPPAPRPESPTWPRTDSPLKPTPGCSDRISLTAPDQHTHQHSAYRLVSDPGGDNTSSRQPPYALEPCESLPAPSRPFLAASAHCSPQPLPPFSPPPHSQPP